jgi:hypothetical protein
MDATLFLKGDLCLKENVSSPVVEIEAAISISRSQKMLPEDYYEQACKLFCRILHRLERLEHGENHISSETTDQCDGSDAIMENGTANVVVHPDLPARQHTRAKKERVSRNAGR